MLNENNIAGRIDRLPLCSVHWKLWLLHEICWILGSVGLATATFTLASTGADFGFDTTLQGLVNSVMFLGMFLGASLSGYLGDKFGRKKMLIVAIAIWALSALLLSWSPNPTVFFLGRFLVGLGMAAQFPMTQSMLSEIFPANYRGRAICMLEGGYPLGSILSGVIAWLLLMQFDWRVVYLANAVGGLCVLIVIFKIPESARWLEMIGRLDQAKAIVGDFEQKVQAKTGKPLAPIPDPIVEVKDTTGKSKFAQLFEREQVRKTLTLWLLWFCVLFGHYGLNTWVSALLVESGFDVVRSSAYTILMYLPAIPGYLLATVLVEKLGRKKMIFIYMVCAAIFCFLYGRSSGFVQLITFGCCMQFFMFGMWSLIYTYASEVFPTRIRSTGCGTTSSAGRFGALIAPTLFGVLLPVVGNSGVFTIGATVFIIGAFITILFGIETKGRSLEEIQANIAHTEPEASGV